MDTPDRGLTASSVKLARLLHVISACWVLLLAIIILIDVLGRVWFDSPLLGATEVIKNSVVSITFLQLPLAIYSGSMLRTTIVSDAVGAGARRLLRTLTSLLGAIFFAVLVYSAWDHMIEAWQIGEYEGEGALRVPTYPVRTLMVITSVFCTIAYLMMIRLDWRGELELESSYPGAHSFDPNESLPDLTTSTKTNKGAN
ncbi:MAG: TRAP transporter small permease [Burkholderiaceae bacterium]